MIFYHFKSVDYQSDKLVESDAAQILKQTLMTYDGIGFSKYLEFFNVYNYNK